MKIIFKLLRKRQFRLELFSTLWAGSLLSRSQEKSLISIEEFKESLEGIYSSSVSENTLSESPMDYKTTDAILNNIDDTVKVLDIAKPIYNFKD